MALRNFLANSFFVGNFVRYSAAFILLTIPEKKLLHHQFFSSTTTICFSLDSAGLSM